MTQPCHVKIRDYVAYMLKIISLTGTPHRHEFLKKVFPRYVTYFVKKESGKLF